jgi:hypothetical protein
MSVLDDPRLGDLFQQAQSLTPTSLPSLDSIVNEGMNSPLMSQIISGALKRQQPNEALARQGVTDAARGAGGLRGTAYMQNVARNEGNILDQRGILTSDVIAKTLQQLISGRLQEQQNSFLPARTLTDLFQAGRPLSGQTSSSQSTSQWGNQGSGDSMGSDFGLNDWLNRVYGPSRGQQYGPGSGQVGVNAPPTNNNPGIANPAPNPYGGYGFPPTGAPGAGGGPEYGPWGPTTYNTTPASQQTSNPGGWSPSGPWVPNTGPGTGTWAGYGPSSEYTAQPGIFQNFPAPVNPYADWQPAEPVPWVSEGEY